MSLTSHDYSLLKKAIVLNTGADESVTRAEQAIAIQELVSMELEKLLVVAHWALSDELIPDFDSESEGCTYDPRHLMTAIVASGQLSLRELLELVSAILNYSWPGTHDVAFIMEKVAFKTMHISDTFAVFRDFLQTAESGVTLVQDMLHNSWCFKFALELNWGPLSDCIKVLAESDVQLSEPLQFWNSLIDARLRTIDFKQLA